MRRSAIFLAVAAALALMSAGKPSPVKADACDLVVDEDDPRWYAYQHTDTFSNGVDGYILGSNFAAPSGGFRQGEFAGYWIGQGCGAPMGWAQIGLYKGYLTRIANTSPNLVAYAEFAQSCPSDAWFNQIELTSESSPPPANYAYYVNWNGTSYIDYLGCRQYRYEYRIGAWASPPAANGQTGFASGVSTAAFELWSAYDDPVWRPYVIAYWGTNNGAPNPSYGLHVYNRSTNTWPIWNSTDSTHCVPYGSSNPWDWISLGYLYAFEVQKLSACN